MDEAEKRRMRDSINDLKSSNNKPHIDLLLQLQMSKGRTKEKPKYNYLAEYTPTPPSLWDSDKIPPLISLNQKPQVKQSEISIQSLNQSEVKSVYTVEKEDFQKQVLDIFNNSTERTSKEAKTEKMPKQKIGNSQPYIKSGETAVNQQKPKTRMQSTARQPAKEFYDQPYDEYKDCKAVKIYSQLVESRLKKEDQSQGGEVGSELDWMKTKTATEMLACVLINPSRMDFYVHYLLKEIHLNEQANIINRLHQEEVRPYNPTLKQVYTNILRLLSKINTPRRKKSYLNAQNNPERRSSSKDKQRPSISLFQNGLEIDLNPRLTAVRKQNAEKIRQLKQKIIEHEQQMHQTRKAYEEIILNYAMTIQNLNKGEEPQGRLHPPLQQSSVRLLLDEQEEEVRKKHHTFGMKNISQRSSRNLK